MHFTIYLYHVRYHQDPYIRKIIFGITLTCTRWNDSMFFSINLYIAGWVRFFCVFFFKIQLIFNMLRMWALKSILKISKHFQLKHVQCCSFLMIMILVIIFFFRSPFHGPFTAHHIKNFLKRSKHWNCWHCFVYIRIETRTMNSLSELKTLIFQIIRQIRIRHSKKKAEMNSVFCKIFIWNIHQNKMNILFIKTQLNILKMLFFLFLMRFLILNILISFLRFLKRVSNEI